MSTQKFMNALANGPASTVALRVTAAAAPITGHHAIVAALAAEVADVPDEALAVLPRALAPLRSAVADALFHAGEDQPALRGAIARLGRSLREVDAGQAITPDRLSLELLGVLRALAEVPAPRGVVARHAFHHLVGVIGAVCGKVLGEARNLAFSAAVVAQAEAEAARPDPTTLGVDAALAGLACAAVVALAICLI